MGMTPQEIRFLIKTAIPTAKTPKIPTVKPVVPPPSPKPRVSPPELGFHRLFRLAMGGRAKMVGKLSHEEVRVLIKSAIAQTSSAKAIARSKMGAQTATGMYLHRSGPSAGNFSVRRPALPGAVGGVA
jgi:hypothetical protein